MSSHGGHKKDVYCWELPVRIFHWVLALTITVLLVTGYYIYNPFFHAPGEVANDYFIMGGARFTHIIAAYIFTANLIFRLYWFYAGNEAAKLRFWRKEFWVGMWETIMFYIFIRKEEPHFVGHNPLAMFSYLLFVWLGSLVMIITGFAMQSEIYTTGILHSMTAWWQVVMGNSVNTRVIHHMVAWAFVMFVVIHVYLSFRHDFIAKNGAVSSIITGYKTESVDGHHDENHTV